MAHDTTMSGAHGWEPGGRRVAVDGHRFRGQTARVSTPWLPDTPSQRHLTRVWRRWLVDAPGTPLLPWQELAALVGRAHRQAARQHVADVRPWGEDVRALVRRPRQVAAAGVAGVGHARRQTPLAGPPAGVPGVNGRLGRHDLTAAHLEGAWAQIACVPVRRPRRRPWEAGHVPDQAAWRVTARRESRSPPAVPCLGWNGPSVDRGRRIGAPPARAALVPPDVPLQRLTDALGGLTFLRTLVDGHGPFAVLGRGWGGHTTTLCRWVLGLAFALWPLVSPWLGERLNAPLVAVDEPWRKIRGRRHSGVVVVAVTTARPVLAAGLPSRRPWACRGVGVPRRPLKNSPRGLITQGLQVDASRVPAAKHLCCRVHPQHGVTHGVAPHVATAAEITTRQPVRKTGVPPRDQRTVRRRLARWRERAPELGMTPWISRVEAPLPQRIGSGGRGRLPSTTTAIARFFRAFQRFDRTRGGFDSVLSATRELALCLVVDVFTPQATIGQAPIEGLVPEARRMPLYRLINDPFRALQERGAVKPTATRADGLSGKAAAAEIRGGGTMQRSRVPSNQMFGNSLDTS